MHKPIDHAGFTAPANRILGHERRTAALAELVATAALALSTLVAVTVLTVGIARADVGSAATGNDGDVFAVILLLGLIVCGIAGCALLPRGSARQP